MIEVKIKLKVKGVEIELTKDEAKELATVLGGMTGVPVKIIEKYRDFFPDSPWISPYRYPTWMGTTANWIHARGGTFTTNAVQLSDNVSVRMCTQEN